ncbi:hypothetical protein EV359DRAFT_68438 [Lentinula novae-zelandiae]|nr:hypothetical protein EV359DRAFT_68438 [Lentinula novae-zelandiae]
MDIPPHLTRARARVARSDEDLPAPRHSASLCQSILGPPPGDAPFQDNPGADGPATPPPTQVQPFVQPAWIVPRPRGEEALHARDAICSSRSYTRPPTPAPGSPTSPDVPAVRGITAFGSPMAQDDPPSDEEWFGVLGDDLYKPNDASAPSGKEGTLPSRRHHSSTVFSTPRDDGLHHLSPGPWGNAPREPVADDLELSPSVLMRDFAEVVVRPASAVPAHHRQQLTSHRGPFRDPSLASVSGHGLQPAPDIRAHGQRGRTSQSHRSRPRARTREPSPGPDFGAHLHRPSRSLSPVSGPGATSPFLRGFFFLSS